MSVSSASSSMSRSRLTRSPPTCSLWHKRSSIQWSSSSGGPATVKKESNLRSLSKAERPVGPAAIPPLPSYCPVLLAPATKKPQLATVVVYTRLSLLLHNDLLLSSYPLSSSSSSSLSSSSISSSSSSPRLKSKWHQHQKALIGHSQIYPPPILHNVLPSPLSLLPPTHQHQQQQQHSSQTGIPILPVAHFVY